MEKFGRFMMNALIVCYAIFTYSIVLKQLWLWFIVPTFGMAPISFFAMYGLMLFARLMIFRLSMADIAFDEEYSFKEKTIVSLSAATFVPLMAFVFGWIAKSLM